MKVKSLSRVLLLATPWTAAYQAPLSMGFSRKTSVFLSRETGISGTFVGRIQGAQGPFVVSFFYRWLTSFPAPLVKEIVFSPLYIHASFVKDKVSMLLLLSCVSCV